MWILLFHKGLDLKWSDFGDVVMDTVDSSRECCAMLLRCPVTSKDDEIKLRECTPRAAFELKN